jgi:hypothetical protein
LAREKAGYLSWQGFLVLCVEQGYSNPEGSIEPVTLFYPLYINHNMIDRFHVIAKKACSGLK